MRTAEKARPAHGFSLIELAVVMSIVAFLMGGLMYTLSSQVEQRNFEDTRRRLDQARELVLGFAIVNGRLPCPASSGSTGYELPSGGGTCDATTGYAGFLPARTIGYQQTDSSGYAVDAWSNRIRYAVSTATPYNTASPQVCRPSGAAPTTPHFTHKDNLRANGIDCQPNDLLVCKSAAGITATTCGGASNQIISTSLVVAVIFSTGKNGSNAAGGGAEETTNLKLNTALSPQNNPIFVWHTPTPSTATYGEFDDQFTWITVGELYGKLLAAGVLP